MIDRRFEYRVAANRILAHCRVRIFDAIPDRPKVCVIVSEAPDNEGMSITNAAEELATQIARAFAFDGESATWVEHWPSNAYRTEGEPERFDLVTFTWRDGVASGPQWRRLAGEEVDRWIGEEG